MNIIPKEIKMAFHIHFHEKYAAKISNKELTES